MSTHLAAGDLTQAVGPVTATGIALVLAVLLVLGVIGKGKKKLATGPAQFVGLMAELAFLRSDPPFRDFGDAFQAITNGIASNPDLGNPGAGIVCLLLLVLAGFARLVPGSAAVIGLLLGAALDAAADQGSIAKAVVALLALPFSLLGV